MGVDNRTTSQGRAPLSPLGRTSQFFRNIIPAGQTAQFPLAGTSFYVTAATAPFDIRPDTGSFNTYYVGTGLDVAEVNAFSNLSIRNTSAVAIVFEIFVGFDAYIDNRVIVSQGGQTLVAYPTYKNPTSDPQSAVAINDLSGAAFADINGGNWYALSREAIYIFNPDSGTTLLLQKAGATSASGDAVGIVYPQTSLRYACAGNYSLSVGGGNINAIVSELYLAIPKTS